MLLSQHQEEIGDRFFKLEKRSQLAASVASWEATQPPCALGFHVSNANRDRDALPLWFTVIRLQPMLCHEKFSLLLQNMIDDHKIDLSTIAYRDRNLLSWLLASHYVAMGKEGEYIQALVATLLRQGVPVESTSDLTQSPIYQAVRHQDMASLRLILPYAEPAHVDQLRPEMMAWGRECGFKPILMEMLSSWERGLLSAATPSRMLPAAKIKRL